jgi:hypothetical protein
MKLKAFERATRGINTGTPERALGMTTLLLLSVAMAFVLGHHYCCYDRLLCCQAELQQEMAVGM